MTCLWVSTIKLEVMIFVLKSVSVFSLLGDRYGTDFGGIGELPAILNDIGWTQRNIRVCNGSPIDGKAYDTQYLRSTSAKS